MLKMSNIAKIYLTDTVKTQALQPFSLDIEAGDFVAVVGPSGSGKTTFLYIAGLLEDYSEGSYFLNNQDVTHLSDTQKSRLRNEQIGFIFQSFNLIPELNLFDNVEMPLRYRTFSAKERKSRVIEALTQVGLANRQTHYPQQLSGGQQQRVAIARALAGSPAFLLADEPTGNLDSNMADGIMSLLKDINASGTSILMVTHDLQQAAQADRIVEIKDGVLTESKQVEKVVA